MRFLLFVVANALTPKLCIHCKHFIGNAKPIFGKCALFSYKEEDDLLNAEINLKKIIKYFKQLGE